MSLYSSFKKGSKRPKADFQEFSISFSTVPR